MQSRIRLSQISSDENSFKQATPMYQDALKKSSYNYQLKFSHTLSQLTENNNQKRNRQRHIIWYYPPYSRNVSTNVGKTFLKIVDEEFPKDHVLHKIFNRNTIKISYCCMSNIKQKIDGHNKSMLSKDSTNKEATPKQCNCRKANECPLSGRYLTKSIIYQATVKSNDGEQEQTYIGLTENTFKTQHGNHKTSSKHESK